jgi:hypothetical protein
MASPRSCTGWEPGQPYVLIDELLIRNQRERRRRGEPEDEPRLDVNLSGFVRTMPV